MAYSTIDDILGEISGEVLTQLVNESDPYVMITADMIKTAVEDGDLSALTEEEAAAATAAAAAVTKCLDRASAQVDGYCSNLYSVPFDSPPAFVKALDLDVAVYNLFSRRENVPENRKDRYANTMKILQGVANGTIQLGVTGPAAPEQKGQSIIASTPSLSVFTPERLRNF